MINSLSDHILLSNYDINDILTNIDSYLPDYTSDSLFFIDPPYVEQGNALYNKGFSKNDHRKLAYNISSFQRPYIITYDNNELIKQLYPQNNMYYYNLKYSANNKQKVGKHTELMIIDDETKLNNQINICPV